jgi:hypothetical protein
VPSCGQNKNIEERDEARKAVAEQTSKKKKKKSRSKLVELVDG